MPIFLCYLTSLVDDGNDIGINNNLKDFMPCFFFIVELREWILSFDRVHSTIFKHLI